MCNPASHNKFASGQLFRKNNKIWPGAKLAKNKQNKIQAKSQNAFGCSLSLLSVIAVANSQSRIKDFLLSRTLTWFCLSKKRTSASPEDVSWADGLLFPAANRMSPHQLLTWSQLSDLDYVLSASWVCLRLYLRHISAIPWHPAGRHSCTCALQSLCLLNI